MSEKSKNFSKGYTFDIKDYLEAANDAAAKTRATAIVLVVASVLIFIGYYNSLYSSWMVRHTKTPFSFAYKPDLSDNGNPADFDGDKYKEHAQQEAVKVFFENVHVLKIPFFGIAIDINDLGAIGGIALIIILMMMRFCLSREAKNLTVSFQEAIKYDQLNKFYNILAMRQVFTLPKVRDGERSLLFLESIKPLYVLPAIIFTFGVIYDYYTVNVVSILDISLPILMEVLWLVPIWYLSLRCLERQKAIDSIWEENWKRIKSIKSSIVQLDRDLIEEFGCDETVNKVLRAYKKNS